MTLAEAQEILASAAEKAHRSDFAPIVDDVQGREYETQTHHAEYGASRH